MFSKSIKKLTKTPLSKTKVGGGQTPFSTIRFLEVRKQNVENLFLPKVLYVTKGCLKNLARAQNPKKPVFGAIDLCPPKYPPTSLSSKTNFADVFQIV